MSTVQFRSRIKPAINYSNVLNSYGYCCVSTNSGLTAERKSYVECFNEGGYFIQSNEQVPPVCPNPETEIGCCCACSYVNEEDFSLIPPYPNNPDLYYYSSGISTGVSKCECERLRGKWTPGPCPQSLDLSNFENFCVKENQDVRLPRSCCHMKIDETSGLPTSIACENVCTQYECGRLSSPGYPSVFGGNNTDPADDTRCFLPLTPNGPYQTSNCGTSVTDINQTSCGSVLEVDKQGSGPFYYSFDFSNFGKGAVIVKYNMFNDADYMRIWYPGISGSDSYNVINDTIGPVTGLGSLGFYYDPTLEDDVNQEGTSFKIFTIEISNGLEVPSGKNEIRNFALNITCPDSSITDDVTLISGGVIENNGPGTVGGGDGAGTVGFKNQKRAIDIIIPKTDESLFDGEIGSCFELKGSYESYSYECRVCRKTDCGGYWVKTQPNVKQYCDIPFKPSNPVKTERGYSVQKMSLSSFKNLGLTAGDEFQGGIYIGIFETPYSGKSSEVFGDITFSNPKFSRFNENQYGSKKDTRWALIVDESIYSVSFLKSSESITNYNSSLYDGYHNTYGDILNYQYGMDIALYNSIRFMKKNGFIDYYVPSIYELNFYAAYLKRKNINSIKQSLLSSSIFSAKYLGAKRNVNTFYGNDYVYELRINPVSDIPIKNSLASVNVVQNIKFFRKIVLT